MSSQEIPQAVDKNGLKSTKKPFPDYFWRDYTGNIPDDAIPGGNDINHKTTYIGQAYHKYGVLIGTIYSGQAAIKMCYNGSITSSTTAVKILCGSNKGQFKWIRATSADLHTCTINKILVIGGYENDEIIHIGRVMYQNELKIGKVQSSNIGKALLFFVHGNNEKEVNSYEVLTYHA